MAIADFDSVNDSYSIVPAGTYLVRVKKFERKISKTSGQEMVQWTAVVVEGAQIGATVAEFTSLSEAGVWKAAKFIKCAGIDITGKVDTGSSKFNACLKACVGQTMYWFISQDPKDGELKNKVETYQPDMNQQRVALSMDDDAPTFCK